MGMFSSPLEKGDLIELSAFVDECQQHHLFNPDGNLKDIVQ